MRQTGTITIPGEPLNSFDYQLIRPIDRHVLPGDRTKKATRGIDVIDTKKGAWSAGSAHGWSHHEKDGTCCNNDKSGPNGVLTINGKEAWVGDGDSTVKVIDLRR